MTAGLKLWQTAAAVGLSETRFRKVWRRWAREMGFPAPFRGDTFGGGQYAWDAEAVAAWKAHRTRALGAGELAPANEDAPAAPPRRLTDRRIKSDRAALARRMGAI